MMTRFVRGVLAATSCMALAAAVLMPAGNAMAEPIPIKISLIKWAGSPPLGKLYKIVSKAEPSLFQLPNCQTNDPLTLGGSLTVTVGDKQLTCDLAAGTSWKVLGTCADPGNTHKGYKYVNKQYSETNPCKVVIIKEKVIKVLAKGVGDLDPPGPQGENPEVEVFLDVGNHRYCALGAPEHFKEKEDSLIKIKDQPVPPVECGNNCAQAGEQCDGTDDALCPGICQANCRCPEPLCGNGVLEVGEDCEPPCSEDPPCGSGTICGKDCTCVPNQPCDCGTPDPSLFSFMTIPGSGVCGEVRDGSDVKLADLDCAKSYLGGGILGSFAVKGTGIPLGTNIHKVECCYGTTLVLGPTTAEETGDRKTCTSTGCALGGPVPTITTPAIISVCSVNYLEFDSFGHMDCSTGEGFISIPMESDTHLVGDGLIWRCSPETTGDRAGYACNDNSECPDGSCLWDWAEHCDSNSPPEKRGVYCISDAQCAPGSCLSIDYYQPCPICNPETSKCNGGDNQGNDCTPQTPDLGPAYPNTQDCMPFSVLNVATTHMPNPLGTATVTKQAPDGQFCGYCRDVEVEGSLCFDGDKDFYPSPGQKQCPDSLVVPNCRPTTYHSDPPLGGNPADIAGCGPLVMPRCNSDAECYAPYESCEQRDLGAFDEAGGRSITMVGSGAGDLRDGEQHAASLAGIFCTPASFSDADPNASLPGPGGSSYPVMFQLTYSPSGAFLELTGGIVD